MNPAEIGWRLFLNGLQHHDKKLSDIGIRMMARVAAEKGKA